MITHLKSLYKTSSLFALLLLCTLPGLAQGLTFSSDLCKEFIAAKEIYLITDKFTAKEFTCSDSTKFTFAQLVNENWSNKKIIHIKSSEYNDLADVKNKFYITITTFTLYYPNGAVNSKYTGICVKKGETEYDPKRMVSWKTINIDDFNKGYLCERIIYDVKTVKYAIENYDDGSENKPYYYRRFDFEKTLSSKTLYIRESDMDPKFLSSGKLQKVYPYKITLVSNEVWEKAFKNKDSQIVLLEKYETYGEGNLNNSGFVVYTADTGKLLFSAYPMLNANKPYLIKENFFNKMLDK